LLLLQFNISDEWYAWENDVIGFANLVDVGLVTYSASDVTGAHRTRWAAEEQRFRFPPQLHDVVSFTETSARRFSVAVRIDPRTYNRRSISSRIRFDDTTLRLKKFTLFTFVIIPSNVDRF